MNSSSSTHADTHAPQAWSVDSWRDCPVAQRIEYPDAARLEESLTKLRSLPPLVTSFEIERLRGFIAEAQMGKRFLLQGGDCAEQMSDCQPELITKKLKILLQMSMVLIYATKKPVIRVGRFAGQYAKPRSSMTETRTINGKSVTLPSYFGDLVNAAGFTLENRVPNPSRMLEAHTHAALTLNFVRSLMEGGFADVHHPEYWDLGFMQHAGLPEKLRQEYQAMTHRLAEGLKFMEAIGERSVAELSRVEFFTSHEGLSLDYESAMTRQVPRRKGWYNLSTHMPWIGERTRALDGAHVEYFRGIRNPLGIKLGPSSTPEQAIDLIRTLNPDKEPGRIVLIARMGAEKVREKLPVLVRGVHEAKDVGPVLWSCDPMHGNASTTPTGIKTRRFTDIMGELLASLDVHHAIGSHLGGLHIELTGDDVTECLGGAGQMGEVDLSRNYQSPCDPRLNYEQALELAFELAGRLSGTKAE